MIQSRRRRLTLLADIGGSNARFALCELGHAGSRPRSRPNLQQRPKPFAVAVLKVADFPDPISACRHYLRAQGSPALAKAAFAVACPVIADRAALTNADWKFDRRRLQQALGVSEMLLLNDFEALAWSLPALTVHDGVQVSAASDHASPDASGRARPRGVAGAPLALIGPGTGLGVSGLLPTQDGWTAIAGEGGHSSLAPADAREAELLEFLWQTHEHVSCERLLCGAGLPLLLRAIAQVDQVRGRRAPDDYQDAASISRAALEGDPLALAAVNSFCAMLGGAAGNLALTLGARGGVYIGGGMVPRFGRLFAASDFRKRFEGKGRFQAYLAAIPVYLITANAPALLGVSFALANRTPSRRPVAASDSGVR